MIWEGLTPLTAMEVGRDLHKPNKQLKYTVTGCPVRVDKVDEMFLFCFVFFWASEKVNVSFPEILVEYFTFSGWCVRT